MDTKFSYYNNHNKHQPRYYCRGCQRHWTLGGHVRHSVRAPKPKRRRVDQSTTQSTSDTNVMMDHLRTLASSTLREQRVLAAQIVCAGVFLRLADGSEGGAFLDALPMDLIAPAIQANLPNLQASLATVTTPPVADATAALMAATALAQPAGLSFPPAAAIMQSQLQSQLQWLMQCSGYGTWQLGGEQLAMAPPVAPAATPAVPPWASLWAGLPTLVPTGVPSLSTEAGPISVARGASSHGV